VPKSALRYLDWSVEEGLKVVISGGVHQPGAEALRGARASAAAAPSAS